MQLRPEARRVPFSGADQRRWHRAAHPLRAPTVLDSFRQHGDFGERLYPSKLPG